MSPTFSVIIPSYNSGTDLNELLKSCLDQSFVDFEVLIIDGNSSDNTFEIVSQYDDSRIRFYSENDEGIFDAMNKGISKAKGQWLYFIGADDRFYNQDTLLNLSNTTLLKEAEIIYGKIYNEKLKQERGVLIKNRIDLLEKAFWHQAMFYHKSVFKKTGLYEIKYKIAADTVFNLNAYCNHNFKWRFYPEVVARFNGSGISSFTFDQAYHQNQYELYKQWFSGVEDKKVAKALQHHLYVEIRSGSLIKAVAEYFKIASTSGEWITLLKNSIYHLKIRLTS